MNPLKASFWLPLMAAMLLGACTTSVGNKTSLDDVNFILGKTSKAEVAQILGLPMAIRSDQSGMELWAYQASPKLSGLIVPVPSGNAVTTWGIDVSKADDDDFAKAAIIYGFDKDGVLLDVIDRRSQQQ